MSTAASTSSAPSITPAEAPARRPKGRKNDSPDVTYSKALSSILRHNAAKEGLAIRSDGYIKVDDLLRRPKLRGLDLDTLKRLVTDSDKQRFALLSEVDPASGDEVLYVKANQGHSIELDDVEMRRIESADEVPTVLHGTYARHWPAIAREGLKPMKRTHVHLASGRFGEVGVKSGVRRDCSLFIYVDVRSAMAGGIEFFVSPNGVILTKGDSSGSLPRRYFARVVDKEDRPVSEPVTIVP